MNETYLEALKQWEDKMAELQHNLKRALDNVHKAKVDRQIEWERSGARDDDR